MEMWNWILMRYNFKNLIYLIDKAKQDGYHTMIAGIDADNQKSCELHKKLGFFEDGRYKEVGYKIDRWLDLVFMQLMRIIIRSARRIAVIASALFLFFFMKNFFSP